MPRNSRLALAAAAGLTAAALLTACGSGGGSTASPTTPPPATTAPANPSAPATPAGKAALATATDPTLGTIVTDGDGHTLYRFDKDTAKPPVSNCNGACATTWPPALAGDSSTVKGIDAKLVSTVTRADGSRQLTLNGWPLYRYAPDTKPGDTKGQGVGGTWFAATPTGGKAGAPAAPSSPGGGYGY